MVVAAAVGSAAITAGNNGSNSNDDGNKVDCGGRSMVAVRRQWPAWRQRWQLGKSMVVVATAAAWQWCTQWQHSISSTVAVAAASLAAVVAAAASLAAKAAA